jgi:hypothetical protein
LSGSVLLYALTILTGAFLLFQIQPVIAKAILPWYGGSAAVWTTCMLFFQVVLLLGYLYAHWLIERVSARRQRLVHAAVLLGSLVLLPVAPGLRWKPDGGDAPVPLILALLAASVGLPYFLLSTTSPLMQAWYSRRFNGVLPYRLFALSNLASLGALLAYPIAIEPFITTRGQLNAWSAAYAGYALLAFAATVRACGKRDLPISVAPEALPDGRTRLLWATLAACPSALFLAVTNHLTQNVAAAPFLWVLPLVIYLLTFVLCFDRAGWYRPQLYKALVPCGMAALGFTLFLGKGSIKIGILSSAIGLFLCCMFCHGELARRKPDPSRLTSFYLMLSAGGALGGVFVGLLAPLLFDRFFELHVAVIACLLLCLALLFEYSSIPMLASLGALLMALAYVSTGASSAWNRIVVRNFYGGLRVVDSGEASSPLAVRSLVHGTISHGVQFRSPGRRMRPTAYYGPHSGVGLALRLCRPQQLRTGIIGLGTGCLSVYAHPGDYLRFYEINPLVIDLAQTQFTFLGDTAARVDIVPGDARLSLERESPQEFDIIVVDAFSGDSIPTHLLTKEAFQLYFRHLRSGGVVAIHISNLYLELRPVLCSLSRSLNKSALYIESKSDVRTRIDAAQWVLLSDDPALFRTPEIRSAGVELTPWRGLRTWTDDYSNLWQVLK